MSKEHMSNICNKPSDVRGNKTPHGTKGWRHGIIPKRNSAGTNTAPPNKRMQPPKLINANLNMNTSDIGFQEIRFFTKAIKHFKAPRSALPIRNYPKRLDAQHKNYILQLATY